MSEPPKIIDGRPSILFDTNPEQQETFIGSYYSSLKSTLYTAMTGHVEPFHQPGQLRLIWWTDGGKKGMKDYDLHKYALVKENFDALFNMIDVKRAVIMGYAGQNPYMLEDHEKFGRRGKGWKNKSEEEERKLKEENETRMNQAAEGRTGKLIDIDAVIEKSDAIDEEKMRKAREAKWKENDGLMSGEMV